MLLLSYNDNFIKTIVLIVTLYIFRTNGISAPKKYTENSENPAHNTGLLVGPSGTKRNLENHGHDRLSPLTAEHFRRKREFNFGKNRHNMYPASLGENYGTSNDDYNYDYNGQNDVADGMPMKMGDIALNFGFGNAAKPAPTPTTTTAAPAEEAPKPFPWDQVLTGVIGGVASVVQASAQREMVATMQKMALLTALTD